MSWGKIKSAINSTVGTSDFKPLDEIILGKYVLSGKTSDKLNTFATTYSGSLSSSSETALNNQIVMKYSGTIKLAVLFECISASSSTAYAYFYEDGSSLGSNSVTISSSATVGGEYSAAITLDVKKGSIYTFGVKCASTRLKPAHIAIYGELMPTVAYDANA